MGENPSFVLFGKHERVLGSQTVSPPTVGYFELGVPNTLSMGFRQNGKYLDERDYLEDYGRNLKDAEIEELILAWKRTGCAFDISSNAGRSKLEYRLLQALVCALAELTAGRVISMDDRYFDLGVGVFTPKEFSTARWLANPKR